MAVSKMMYVYDVTTKTNVAVCLPRDGMETVGWVMCAVEKKLTTQLACSGRLNTLEECIDLSVGGILVGPKRKLGRNAWERSVASYLLFGGPWIVRSRTTARFVGGRTGQIFATMVNGKTITLDVTAQDTILQIKQKVEEKEGVPLLVQSMQACGKLLKDSCTLESYQIGMGYTIFVLVGGPGGAKATVDISLGGVNFADVTKIQSGLKVRAWCDSAPKYRQAAPGLCLEGICTHSPCQAHKKRVIVNMGFQEGFDLCRDCYKSECPLCSEHVQPVTVAFNNCKWKSVGEKVSPKQPSKPFQSEWHDADNNYYIFDEKETGTVRWLNLTFMTVDRSQQVDVPECGICLEPLCTDTNAKDPAQTLACGHELHRSCIKKLKHYGLVCPFCSAQISSYQKKRSGGLIDSIMLSRTLCTVSL